MSSPASPNCAWPTRPTPRGDLAAALISYDLASTSLKTPVLAARAQLGAAITRIQSGQVNEGMQTLKQLADNPKQFQALRAEAVYHLASLAAVAGQADQVRQLSAQLLQIDPTRAPGPSARSRSRRTFRPAAAPAPAAGRFARHFVSCGGQISAGEP